MSLENRTDWFMHDRLGMFIHWGLYSIPARGEWVRAVERISVEDYQKYFDAFDPTRYDPAQWAKLAKEAGMKYAVMTAKHHDGFCLFDSAYTEYKSTNTKSKRDLIAEYVEAFRAEGLKVGIYYSLLDWHHPDYPHYHDLHHPMRGNPAYQDLTHDFSRYVEYMHNQVRELLTNYGKIDILWFDFSYDSENMKMEGETWKAKELHAMVRELQPHAILDNRLTYHGHSNSYGDFASPEQILPREGIRDNEGNPIPWEACITLNNHWGYCVDDHDYKSARDIVRALVECTSKNGNLIVNVGPDARGVIPDDSVWVLRELGDWMRDNGESIYGCSAALYTKPEWGRLTQKDGRLYAHIFDRGIGAVVLEGMHGKIESARYLHDKAEVNIAVPWNATGNTTDAFLNLSAHKLPCETDTVVELCLNSKK